MQLTWKATPPQSQLWRRVFDDPHSWAIAFVAGFGSGKSEVMHMVAVATIALHPWADVAIYAPTYDLIKLNNLPRIEGLLSEAGIGYTLNKQDLIITSESGARIIFRSMDNPGRIIAYEVYLSLIDELDTMPTARAAEAWNKVISRNRQQPPDGTIIPAGTIIETPDGRTKLDKPTPYSPGAYRVVNKTCVFTTPEGFKLTYRKWVKERNDGYVIVRASSYSNPHLPPSYIDSLKSSYPPELIDAYLEGEFVNLTGGRVYHAFNRDTHHFPAEALLAA